MHAHGFIALIFASLVLATPGLGVRRLALVLAIGVPLVFALCTLMLMSDVALWEARDGRVARPAAARRRAVPDPARLRRGATPNGGGGALAGGPVGAARGQANAAARVKIARHIARVSTPVLVF